MAGKTKAQKKAAPKTKPKPRRAGALRQPDEVKANTKLTREEKRIGRPPMISDEITEKVANAIRSTGAYLETAALYAGISKETLHLWLRKGNEARKLIDKGEAPPGELSPYLAFLHAVEKAIADADMVDLLRVRRAADWKAAGWRLERRHPGEWGRQRLEITGKDGTPVATRLEIEVVASRSLTKEEFLNGVRGGDGDRSTED